MTPGSRFLVATTLIVGLLAGCSGSTSPEQPRITSLPPSPNDYNFVHPPEIPCGDPGADLSYRVPLSPEQEKRAQDLYKRSYVVLGHLHCVEPSDFVEMVDAGITAAVLKLDVDGINMLHGKERTSTLDEEDFAARGTRSIERILAMAQQPGSPILIARQIEDIRRAKEQGKVAIILSFEGGRSLAGKLESLTRYYEMGLRDMQLWWAVPNALKSEDGTQLTDFGKSVIREMNRLGVVIDLSHLRPPAFWTALATTKEPVLISHCAVEALYYDEPRPPTDELSGTDHLNDAAIRAMARNGGSICIHFVTPDYIRARHGAEATIEDLVDHIAYVRDLVGADYVSIGADLFPLEGWRWVEGAGRLGLIPNVARELVRRDFTDEEIEKILGGNLMRVFERVWRTSS